MPVDAAQRFVEGLGHTGLNPSPPNPPPSRPSSPPPAMDRPSGVLTAMAMLGINALVLLVLTLIGIADAADAASPGWGGVVLTGVWGALSMVGALGLLSRSRLVFALVVVVQGVAAVFLALRVFAVIIYTPELLVIYALMLLYTLAVGGLLLLPATSRAYFRLG